MKQTAQIHIGYTKSFGVYCTPSIGILTLFQFDFD